MTVYIIAQITISDREEYGKYEEGFMEIFDKYEGELLSVDEGPDVIEGSWTATRTVLLSFPSVEAAKTWYDSDEYQALAQHRFAASSANLIMVPELDQLPG